jgi:nitroreductase
MRRLKSDPVSDEDLWKILETATKAPNGGNRQPWNFVVVRDAAAKTKIAAWYLEAWNQAYGGRIRDAMMADANMSKTWKSANYLANHMADVPVLVLATIKKHGSHWPTLAANSAVQNLMLAARAIGLGTALTTLHKMHEDDVKALLGIPDDVETMALIPVGWPQGQFGPVNRLPVEKVVYWDGWGQKRSRE